MRLQLQLGDFDMSKQLGLRQNRHSIVISSCPAVCQKPVDLFSAVVTVNSLKGHSLKVTSLAFVDLNILICYRKLFPRVFLHRSLYQNMEFTRDQNDILAQHDNVLI